MADRLLIRRVQDGDQEYLAANMRLIDRLECMLIAGLEAGPALDISVARAVACWTAELDGVIVAMFGVNRKTQTSSVGIPWLLGTDGLGDMSALLGRQSVRWTKHFKRAFPKMENYIHVDNAQTIHWLRWLGFAMDDPAPCGVAGECFIRFHMGMTDNVP